MLLYIGIGILFLHCFCGLPLLSRKKLKKEEKKKEENADDETDRKIRAPFPSSGGPSIVSPRMYSLYAANSVASQERRVRGAKTVPRVIVATSCMQEEGRVSSQSSVKNVRLQIPSFGNQKSNSARNLMEPNALNSPFAQRNVSSRSINAVNSAQRNVSSRSIMAVNSAQRNISSRSINAVHPAQFIPKKSRSGVEDKEKNAMRMNNSFTVMGNTRPQSTRKKSPAEDIRFLTQSRVEDYEPDQELENNPVFKRILFTIIRFNQFPLFLLASFDALPTHDPLGAPKGGNIQLILPKKSPSKSTFLSKEDSFKRETFDKDLPPNFRLFLVIPLYLPH